MLHNRQLKNTAVGSLITDTQFSLLVIYTLQLNQTSSAAAGEASEIEPNSLQWEYRYKPGYVRPVRSFD